MQKRWRGARSQQSEVGRAGQGWPRAKGRRPLSPKWDARPLKAPRRVPADWQECPGDSVGVTVDTAGSLCRALGKGGGGEDGAEVVALQVADEERGQGWIQEQGPISRCLPVTPQPGSGVSRQILPRQACPASPWGLLFWPPEGCPRPWQGKILQEGHSRGRCRAELPGHVGGGRPGALESRACAPSVHRREQRPR